MNAMRNTLAGAIMAASAFVFAPSNFVYADTTTAAPAPAAGGHHHFGPGKLYAQLGLSPEQKQSIDAIFAANGPTMKNLHQQIHANSMKLHQTTPDDPNYNAVVSQVSQANSALMTQEITARESTRAQIYALLTPTQKTQLATLKAQMQARWQANGGHWGHRPPSGAPPAGTTSN